MAELRIGLVGTGGIGRTHIERINTRLQGGVVIGCADVNVDFGKSVAEKFGIKGYDGPEALINDPEIDAVIVTASDDYHAPFVLEAIKAGKPVFCEKPLSPTPEKCREIVEAEMASGKHLVQVGFMRRYDPGYVQLKNMIDSGKYGAPLVLHCCHHNYDDGGVGWKTSMSVENSMIHEIDVLRWLLGENYKKVDVVFPRCSKNASEGCQDPQIMHLTTESGTYIEVESFVFSHYGYDVRCEIVCEEGVLNLPEPPYAMVRTNDARVTPICHDWSERFPDAYNIEFQNWINASKEGRVDGPTAWDGYVAQIAAGCASKARDTQTTVEIDIPEMPEFYKA
ncbi:MAG: Gfo/Idh/MocA family oxidoreductase [Eubacterium sp.]|nr:Gfo/Idh/MocA family oxidoreductase [Eubacterium sp.]